MCQLWQLRCQGGGASRPTAPSAHSSQPYLGYFRVSVILTQAAFLLSRCTRSWFLLKLEILNVDSSNFNISEGRLVCGSSAWSCSDPVCEGYPLASAAHWQTVMHLYCISLTCLEFCRTLELAWRKSCKIFFFFFKYPVNMFHLNRWCGFCFQIITNTGFLMSLLASLLWKRFLIYKIKWYLWSLWCKYVTS